MAKNQPAAAEPEPADPYQDSGVTACLIAGCDNPVRHYRLIRAEFTGTTRTIRLCDRHVVRHDTGQTPA